MKLSHLLLSGACALILAACSQSEDSLPVDAAPAPPAETASTAEPAAAEAVETAAAASYSLDKTHAFLSFTVMHNGLSRYTVDFTDFDATLDFDPSAPEASSLSVAINPLGLNVNYPGDYSAGHSDSPYASWPEALSKDARFLNGETYPEITFVSTSIAKTGDTTGTVTGDLTFLGVTKPVTLDVKYNGVGSNPRFGDRDLIGFDATTKISRSEFGQDSLAGIISDDVEIKFSAEFLQDE